MLEFLVVLAFSFLSSGDLTETGLNQSSVPSNKPIKTQVGDIPSNIPIGKGYAHIVIIDTDIIR